MPYLLMEGQVMKSPKFIIILCVTIVALSIFGLVSIRGQKDDTLGAKKTVDQTVLYRDIFDKGKIPQIYGKIKIPAELSFELSPNEDSEAPVTFVMSALSAIPIDSGKISLKIPQIGSEQAGSIELWSGTPLDFVNESLQYMIDDLPVGTYKFVLVFEFEPLAEEPKTLAVSKSLYLDVRPTKILSSNVSFQHIKRLELMKEFHQRVLEDMRSELENADAKTKAREIAAIESFDPELIVRKIEQLKTSDPYLARRIMELNKIEIDSTGESDSRVFIESAEPDLNEGQKAPSGIFYNQPAIVQEVPVPEELMK